MRPLSLLPLLLLAACAQGGAPAVSSETMPECMARMHIEDPQAAPAGLHTACMEFVSEANGGRAEAIHQQASEALQTDDTPPNSSAIAAALLIGAAAGAAAAYHPPVYYQPPPVVTTTCNRFGNNTTCTSY